MNETHNEYNLSKIETYFNSLLENNLSDHVFVGGLPKTMGEGWTDAVMIDCDSSVFDLDAYADGIININLYAKKFGNTKLTDNDFTFELYEADER